MIDILSNGLDQKKNLTKFSELTNRFLIKNTSQPWNQIIIQTPEYIVTPTLGSVVPNWLIIWPKRNFLNCREWMGSISSLGDLAANVIQGLPRTTSKNYTWFEHGCSTSGNLTGCGVNFAHLHLIVEPSFSFSEFTSAVLEMNDDNWVEDSDVENTVYPVDNNYHTFGNERTHFYHEHSDHLGSQFFRKVIASLNAKESFWDYKTYPFEENAQQTIRNLSV